MIGESGTFAESVPETPPTISLPQYSPSISHDEVEYEGMGGSNTSSEDPMQRSKGTGQSAAAGDEAGQEWAGLDEEEKGSDWGESWSDIEDTTELNEQEELVSKSEPSLPPSASSAKLVLKSPGSSMDLSHSKEGRLSVEEEREGGSSSKQSVKGLGKEREGRSSTSHAKRLEEVSARATEELDLFADMLPKITPSGSLSAGLVGGTNYTSPINATPTSALQYQPKQEVSVVW